MPWRAKWRKQGLNVFLKKLELNLFLKEMMNCHDQMKKVKQTETNKTANNDNDFEKIEPALWGDRVLFEILLGVKVGAAVWFDDGDIVGNSQVNFVEETSVATAHAELVL